MPYSKNQKIAAAIAEHNPAKLNTANKGMLSMSQDQLHDFASGPVKPKTKIGAKLAALKK